MRVLFARRGMQTARHYKGLARNIQNLPRSVSTSYDEMKQNFGSTRNKGNMFIAEAAQRIIKCDRSMSAHVNIQGIKRKDPVAAAEFCNSNFDHVIMSVANIIRPSLDHSNTAAFVDALEIPFSVLAAGMQSPLDGGLDDLPDAAVKMLKLYDKKAALFGVRGRETAAWLNKCGLHNCVVVGCPSNFLYPQNFLAASLKDVDPEGYFATSGYIIAKPDRAELLSSIFRNVRADYIMQEDFFHDKSPIIFPSAEYNDATGECNAFFISESLKSIFPHILPAFQRYFYFQSTEAWRSRVASYDAFIGDRYHGGVAALQAGVPSMIMHRDIRVREMADWVGIPNASLEECSGLSAKDIVKSKFHCDALAEFREKYLSAFDNFLGALSHAGLEHDLDLNEVDQFRA